MSVATEPATNLKDAGFDPRSIPGNIQGALEDISVPSYAIDNVGVIRWLNPAAIALIGVLFTAIGSMGAYIGHLHVERIDELVRKDALQEGRIFTLEQQVRQLDRASDRAYSR